MFTFENVIADKENKKRQEQKDERSHLWKEQIAQEEFSEQMPEKGQRTEKPEVVVEL